VLLHRGPIKVLLIDSAPVYRTRLLTALGADSDLAPLEGAANTAQARQSVLTGHPDVIILDLGLTRGDALAFLRKLREHYPVPVFVTCEAGSQRASAALRAIELGALEILAKPRPGDQSAFDKLVATLSRRMKDAVAHARPVPPPHVPRTRTPQSWRSAGVDPSRWVVAVGASTGGTEAIRAFLTHVPPDFPPVIITQHMPAGFTRNFAERLDAHSPLHVTEAAGGESLTPGMALVARGDTHLELRRRGRGFGVVYGGQNLVNNHCPAVGVMFDSIAQHAGSAGIGVLLTGMGADGAQGLLNIRRAGGLTFAQDERSCVVFGMPKVAFDLNAVQASGTPTSLPHQIHDQVVALTQTVA
jgi:two-component system chemotaxis response regulator CheB